MPSFRSYETRLKEDCKLLSGYSSVRVDNVLRYLVVVFVFVLNLCFNCVIEFIHRYAYQKTNIWAYVEYTKQPHQVIMTQNILPNLSIKCHLLSILKITFIASLPHLCKQKACLQGVLPPRDSGEISIFSPVTF